MLSVHVMLCAYEQPPGMMMSPMMRGMNSGGYYPGPYDVSCTVLCLTSALQFKYGVLSKLQMCCSTE